MKKLLAMCFIALVMLVTGCKSILPVDNFVPKNQWASYDEALAAFEKIIPHQTTVHDLRAMGFDPLTSPNMKVMTYLDISQRFLHNQSVSKDDLPPDVLSCLQVKEGCKGFELAIESTQKKRYGSFPLDAFGFRKNTHITGWSFRALLVIQNEVVTYKLSSGEPKIDKFEKKGKPLGPFQELEGLVTKLPGMI